MFPRCDHFISTCIAFTKNVLNDTLNRFLQWSSQPSDALKFSTFILSANSMALVLKTRAETPSSLLRRFRIHLNIAWSKFAKVRCLNRWHFELLPFFVASKILSLFFSQVDKVFFGIPYFAATCVFVFHLSVYYLPLPLTRCTYLWWTLHSTCDY